MNLNSRHRILGFLLAMAFVLPIVIKAQHMMFPNHEHHCHSCTNHTPDVADICAIQDFDYFYFDSTDMVHIPAVSSIELISHKAKQTIKIQTPPRFDFSLRAPPEFFEI
ncbi:hypothetical protein [Marinifilum sp. D714]|uniref:hypothetical protein n=1 Tax=Marinifilum sp. D714 TaxID=2937523 RepID=UPI0027C35313|nr:hypothetical protein [Marinifilum sp. D714]MDQ2180296.1 hypothetical protein [Marinifilum sp. D714]